MKDVNQASFVKWRCMSSKHHGRHRKPGKTARFAAIAGVTAATGMIVTGLVSTPASASETVPQASTIAQVSDTAHLAWLHMHHIGHMRHLQHMDFMRQFRERQHRQRTWTAVNHSSAITSYAGIYSSPMIERLWDSVGGASWAAPTAACIAHFESGGNPDAISPTDDFGLMQINASHGPAMATLNPVGNMEAAVTISSDGTNWGAWTTAPDCGV
jgi:hypothetical protein